jgi:hypothetical protein
MATAQAARTKAAPAKGRTRSTASKVVAPAKQAPRIVPAKAKIPQATGRCGFTGAYGQCRNPGRWQVDGVLSCTTHKNATKRTAFDPVAAKKAAAKAKAAATRAAKAAQAAEPAA